jgi:superfamily I DNA/RNA helicase
VVGDADQSIYAFRGATIRNIEEFEQDYPDAKVILLEQNYRSTQNILAVANALIERNVQRKPKSLWTDASGGELTVQYRAQDEHEEAFFVAQEIERLRQQEGYRYKDVAIFYRTNAQSRVVEDVLMRIGLPYRVFGGVRFYQRKEVKDVLGYLRLLVNPQDVISFRRVVNMPKRGIGDATVSVLESFARDEEITVMDACRRVDEISLLAARAKGAVAGFASAMSAPSQVAGRQMAAIPIEYQSGEMLPQGTQGAFTEYVRLDAPEQTRLCPSCFSPDGANLIAFGIQPHAVTAGSEKGEFEKRIAGELIEADGPELALSGIGSLVASDSSERLTLYGGNEYSAAGDYG